MPSLMRRAVQRLGKRQTGTDVARAAEVATIADCAGQDMGGDVRELLSALGIYAVPVLDRAVADLRAYLIGRSLTADAQDYHQICFFLKSLRVPINSADALRQLESFLQRELGQATQDNFTILRAHIRVVRMLLAEMPGAAQPG